jgi:mannitol 2-dehydrogenase
VSVALRARTLADLAGTVAVPTYDRSAVRTGIVHIGVGGFHRAHQAMYVDRLMNAGGSLDWGICGVGLLPRDRRMKDVLDAQEGLYTLVLKHPDGTLEPRVVGSIVDYLFAPDDPEAAVERLAAPATRIVSLTITEGGYNIRHATGTFDESEPDIVADLRPGAVPTTVFGLVTEALARRRDRGVAPFTVMSCDNIAGNGHVAAAMFGAFARLRDPDLGAWMRDHVCFPDSMVDRITPATTDEDRALVAERFGIADGWPVVCEPFTQWVLEDEFGDGRPPLEDVGVQIVDDVEPYELMKLRLLNGGHQTIGYLGYLGGHRYTHEVCQDPLFVRFLRDYMDREATPTLPDVPGIDLDGYKRTLVERFANPHVADTLARLCVDSSERIPTFVLPVIRHQLETGGRDRPVGARGRRVGALRRGDGRERPRHRRRRPACRRRPVGREPTTPRPHGLPRQLRAVRGSPGERPLRRRVLVGAALAARARSARHARTAGGMRRLLALRVMSAQAGPASRVVAAVIGWTARSSSTSPASRRRRAANKIGGLSSPYRSSSQSQGEPIACDSGLVLNSHAPLESFTSRIDTLVVSGGLGFAEAASNAALVAHVRRLARESRRVASVCTGASVLAAAGLLDGLRATTHWRFAGRLAAEYPAVDVDPDRSTYETGASRRQEESRARWTSRSPSSTRTTAARSPAWSHVLS